jgi:chromosomal replication initiator protein
VTELTEQLTKVVIDLTARVKALEKAIKPLPSPKPRPIIAELIRQAEVIYGVPAVDIMGTSRVQGAVRPRQWVMYEAAEAGCSTVKIGRELGGRDHTTVIHGIKAERHRRMNVGELALVFQSRRV